MTLYQLRVHAIGPKAGRLDVLHQAFTVRTDALTAYSRAQRKHAGHRHRISLYQVTTPERLTATDWVAILSDDGIPGLEYERIRESHLEQEAA